MRSQPGDLFDELDHLALFNRSGAVLVELTEALVEVFVVEASTVGHIGEGVANELLGLFLVKVAIAIGVVLSPDLVDALCDDIVDLRIMGHCSFSNSLP